MDKFYCAESRWIRNSLFSSDSLLFYRQSEDLLAMASNLQPSKIKIGTNGSCTLSVDTSSNTS